MVARRGEWYIEQGHIDLTTCPYSRWNGNENHCRWCDKKLPRGWRTYWCCIDCEKGFYMQHEFSSTRVIVRDASRGGCECPDSAFERSSKDPDTGETLHAADYAAHTVCTDCNRCAEAMGRPLEVNHIIPRIGNKDPYSCLHHTDNLEVLCHFHHRMATEAQLEMYPQMRQKPKKESTVKSSYKVRASRVAR